MLEHVRILFIAHVWTFVLIPAAIKSVTISSNVYCKRGMTLWTNSFNIASLRSSFSRFAILSLCPVDAAFFASGFATGCYGMVDNIALWRVRNVIIIDKLDGNSKLPVVYLLCYSL